MKFVPDDPSSGGGGTSLSFVPDAPKDEGRAAFRKGEKASYDAKRDYSIPEEAFGAVVEPVVSMASKLVAKPAADIATLGAIPAHALGLTKTEPKDVRTKVQEALTIEPQTKAGASAYNPLNAIPGAVGGALGMGGDIIANIVKALGGGAGKSSIADALAAGSKEAFEQIPQILGTRAGARAAAEKGPKQAALDIERGENIGKDRVRDMAHDPNVGYITPPEKGAKAAISGLGGAARNEKLISEHNTQNATKRMGAEVGVPDGQALLPETLEAKMREQYDRYDKLRDAVGPEVQVTPAFRDGLRNTLSEINAEIDVSPELKPARDILRGFVKRISPAERSGRLEAPRPGIVGTIEETAKTQPGPRLASTIEAASADFPGARGLAPGPRVTARPAETMPTLSSAFVTKQISALRRKAKDDFAKHDSDSAYARLGVASLMEDMLEENIGRAGPQALADFRDARKTLAQLHFLEKVTNDATGMVDLPKVAAASNSRAYKGALTGAFKDAADFAKTFPHAARRSIGEEPPRLTVFDGMFLTGGIAGALMGHPGALAAAAGEVGTRVAIPYAAQRGMLQNRTPSYQAGTPNAQWLLPLLGLAGTQGALNPPQVGPRP
jgi:hypothetical protein